MLATALIVLSLCVTALAVLDFLLSEAQKKVISDVVIATWNVLDEARKWSFSDWLKNPRASWWLAITLGLLFAIAVVALLHQFQMAEQQRADLPDWIAIFFIAATFLVALIFITRPIFSRFLKLGGRLWHVLLIAAVIHGLAAAVGASQKGTPTTAFWILMVVSVPATILLYVTLMIYFTRFLAYLASGILFVAELIFRRIAEYPKGPIIAVSAIFGGLVSLVKLFSG